MELLICIVGEQGSGRHHLAQILKDKYGIPEFDFNLDAPIQTSVVTEQELLSLKSLSHGFAKIFATRIFADFQHVIGDYLSLGSNEFDYFIYNDYTSFLNVRVDHLITYIQNNGK